MHEPPEREADEYGVAGVPADRSVLAAAGDRRDEDALRPVTGFDAGVVSGLRCGIRGARFEAREGREPHRMGEGETDVRPAAGDDLVLTASMRGDRRLEVVTELLQRALANPEGEGGFVLEVDVEQGA